MVGNLSKWGARFAFLLSFVLAFSLFAITPAFAADESTNNGSSSNQMVEPKEGTVATVKESKGTVTEYDSLNKALQAAEPGSVVTLLTDLSLSATSATKNFGVTLDLNGHNVTSSVTSKAVIQLKTNYSSKPVEGIDSTIRLINSVPGQGGVVSGVLPVSASAGNSDLSLPVEIGEGVTLSPSSADSDAIELKSSAYLKYNETSASLYKNGGFKVTAEDGDRIYGQYANAAAASADGPVTLLNDYTGTNPIKSGSKGGTLDLGGHTYTYTGETSSNSCIVEINYDDVSLVIKNGNLAATSDAADGVLMLYSGTALTLENVEMEIPGGNYGIATNGSESNNSITLKNSTLSANNGAGIYFPCTGEVVIENSTINAKNCGIQLCAGSLTVKGESTSINVTGNAINKTENDGLIADGAAISIVKRAGYQDLGTVTVEGGTFTAVEKAVKAYTFNNGDRTEGTWEDAGKVVAISGGVYSSPVPAALCADGLSPVTENGQNTVGVDEGKLVALVNAEGKIVAAYDTISEAVNAASEGQIITLRSNVTESVTLDEGVDITLDLAGFTLTNSEGQHTITVNEGAKLAIKDSSEAQTGTVDNVTHAKGALVNFGDTTVESGTLTRSAEASTSASDNGGNSWYVVDNQGTLTFNGGKVVNEGYYSSLIRNLNGTLTVNDGEFSNHFIALKNDNYGVMNIAGGTITSKEQSIQNWSEANISGGELNGAVFCCGYSEGGLSVTTISGDAVITGDVTMVNYKNATTGPSLSITGGTVIGTVSKAIHGGTSGIQPVPAGDESSSIQISNGSFSEPIEGEFIIQGSGFVENEDGTFGIQKAELTSSNPDTIDVDEVNEITEADVLNQVHINVGGYSLSVNQDQLKTLNDALKAKTAGEYSVEVTATKGGTSTGIEAMVVAAKKAIDEKAGGQPETLTTTVTYKLAAFYEVTFDDCDSNTTNAVIKVESGTTVAKPATDPTFEGYKFLGWYTGTFDENGAWSYGEAYDFNTPVTSDLLLVAKWEQITEEPTPGPVPEEPTDEGKDVAEGEDTLAETGDSVPATPVAAVAFAALAAAGGAAYVLRKQN